MLRFLFWVVLVTWVGRLLFGWLSRKTQPAPTREASQRPSVPLHRDPVCGMAIGEKSSAVHLEHAGLDFYFCSDGCRTRFLTGPERYLAARQHR